MARQKLSRKSVNKLRRKTGLDIAGCYIRGNTDHRISKIPNHVEL